MKPFALWGCAFVVSLFVLASCKTSESQVRPEEAGQTGQAEQSQQAGAKMELPASLDALYPPRADKPLYLLMMLELASGFDGMLADVQQGDFEGARGTFQRFSEAWAKLGQAVPEWSRGFSPEPLQAIDQALQAQDSGKVFAAAQQLGERCHMCHTNHLADVQYKYRWPSFHQVKAKGPGGEEIGFSQVMQNLAVSMSGIGNDLAQGQQENAAANARAFKANFALLKQTCDRCHDTPRAYFVDASIQKKVDALEQAVASGGGPGAQRIPELMQAIGNGSCGGCHMVHMPAALAKERLHPH